MSTRSARKGARNADDENGDHSKQAIHQHRRDSIDADDSLLRKPVRADCFTANTGGQKRAAKCDEENPLTVPSGGRLPT